MQNFGKQIRCIMGDVQVVYSAFFSLGLQSQTKVAGNVVQQPILIHRKRVYAFAKYLPSLLFNVGI